jgi:hypothetical protein
MSFAGASTFAFQRVSIACTRREEIGMKRMWMRGGLLAAVLASTLALAAAAAAAIVVPVSPPGTPFWAQDDTRPGGTVSWTGAWGAPPGLGTSALQLTTNNTTTAKAGLYTHVMAGLPLRYVNRLGYWTYQASAPFAGAAASYQLQLDTDGTLGDGLGFTTLVYEPYQSGPTPVLPGVWQQWDVDAGTFWSTRSTACGLIGAPGGPASYTLAAVKTACPNAVVVGIGVNIGSNNPLYVVATDGVDFMGIVSNFELRRSGGGD